MTEVRIALSIEEAADYTVSAEIPAETGRMEKASGIEGRTESLIKTDMLEKFMTANEGRDLRDKGNVRAVTRNVTN